MYMAKLMSYHNNVIACCLLETGWLQLDCSIRIFDCSIRIY